MTRRLYISSVLIVLLSLVTPSTAHAEWRDDLPDGLRLNGRFFQAGGHMFDRPLLPTGNFAGLNFRLNGMYRLDDEWKLEFAYMADWTLQAKLGHYPQYEFPELIPDSPLGLDSTIDVHENWALGHRMDRLALIYRHGDFTLDLGRQRIAWGSTMLMSVLDAFHPIAPGDPFAPEQKGTDAIRLQVATGPVSGWDMLYAWIDDAGNEAYALKYHGTFGDFESAISAGSMDSAEFASFETSGDINDIGIRTELVWRNTDDGDKWQMILESDMAPNTHTYVSGAVLYNGPGATDPLEYSIEEIVTGGLYSARWYTGVNCSYNTGGLSTLGLFGLANLTDDSWFTDVSVQHSLSNNADLRIGWQHFQGDLISEYGAMPDMLYLVRTVYF